MVVRRLAFMNITAVVVDPSILVVDEDATHQNVFRLRPLAVQIHVWLVSVSRWDHYCLQLVGSA